MSRSRSSYALRATQHVMAGLVPAIHAFARHPTVWLERDAQDKVRA